MKKLLSLVLAAVLALALSAPVCADVIFEPQDNFYERHADECEYYDRSCYINGKRGYAEVYSSPNASRPDAVIPNGALYWVSWTWKGWACIEYDPAALDGSCGGSTGWVKLEDMSLKYDGASFFAEHSTEIVTDGMTLTLTVEQDNDICVYEYPGSGELRRQGLGAYGDGSDDVEFTTLYTDLEGRVWGYLGYFYGHVDGWLCLSDPENAALESDANYRAADLIPAADAQTLKAAERGTGSAPVLVTALAAAVVVIAAGIIIFKLKRKKAE